MKKTLLLSVCVLFLYSILAQFQFVAGQNEKTIDTFEIKKSVPQQENATEKKCSTDTAPQTQNKQNPKIDPRYVALLEKRVELSKENLSDAKMAFDHSVVYYDVYAEANNISIDAEMALYRYVGKRKELIAALEEKLKVVKEMCSRVESLKAHGAPGGTVLAFNKARLAVIDVELALFHEKELQSSNCETKTNDAKNPVPKQENATEKNIDSQGWVVKKFGEPFKFQNKNKTDPTKFDSFIVTITVRIDTKDYRKFVQIMATRTEKLRDIVYTLLRESKEEELTSPSLLSIKQKIMTKINEELDYPFVKEVFCTDMSFSTF